MRKVRAVVAALCVTLPIVGAAGVGKAQEGPKASELPTYTNSIGMELVRIPAGTALVETGKNMFDEPVFGAKALVSQPFYLGKYEVTQEQWAKVMGSNPAKFKGRNNPVESVSWDDVQEFIKRLNALEGHDRYRLPTEMEWGLAARGGADTVYFFGETEEALSDYAWFADNTTDRTKPVGRKQPNPYGLYDVYGNVREWVQDRYGAYPKDTELKDYSGPASGSERVVLGGAWSNSADDFHYAFRTESAPGARSDSLGFRLALSPFDLPTYTDSLGMEFVLIPANSFMITPDTKATVSKPFYLGKYEVTQAQWKEVMGSNPSYYTGDTLPVDSVSWDDVQEFIKRLNTREGHNRYRLPTEVEWELAARGGTTDRYFFGKTADLLGDYAWFTENARLVTHPVGSKLPNPYGLYDIYGNVWEWTQDWYAPYPETPELKDYSGPESGVRRVIRGGSWNNAAVFCRSNARSSYMERNRLTGVGFRLALNPE